MYKKDSKRDNILLIEIIALIIVIAFAVFMVFTVCSDAPSEPIIDTSCFVDIDSKNNIDLVSWAENAYENGWGYVYGTWGNVLTQDLLTQKSAQYPIDVGGNIEFIRQNYMGKRVTDCIGLIKGYCWFSGDSGFVYCSNNMPDVGANRLFEEAVEKGEIETIPEIEGIAVWAKGHIGIYIGDGWVIEAMSTLDGVKKTRIEDRPWTHWCKIPYIEYIE